MTPFVQTRIVRATSRTVWLARSLVSWVVGDEGEGVDLARLRTHTALRFVAVAVAVAVASHVPAAKVALATPPDPSIIFEMAVGIVTGDLYDGIKGNMGIRTDPNTTNNVTYVHLVQVVLPGNVDFIAVGTVKGEGTHIAGASNCADHYDPGANWSGYVEKDISGVYICTNSNDNFFFAGDNPTFEIQYKTCQASGLSRWVVTFNGIVRSCIYSGNTQGTYLAAGLEVDNSLVDKNIDVKFTNLKKNHPGSTTWSDLGSTNAAKRIDNYYSYTDLGSTAFNVFLAPLD